MSVTGLEYALIALLFFGLADIVYKRAVGAGVLPHQLLMVQSFVFLTAMAGYGWATGTLTFVAGSLWGALAGLFMWLGFHNFAHSLRSGSVSVNAPIFRLSFIITAGLAILLLGEPLTLLKTLGMALAVIAIWLLLAVPAAERGLAGRKSRSSLPRVCIATAAVGVGNLLLKYGLNAGATPASLVVLQAAVVITFSSALAFAIERRIWPAAVTLRYAPVTAILLAVAFAALTESLARGEASKMVPISQMGLAVSAAVGFVAFRERLSFRKISGLIAALGALAAFSFG